MDGLKLSLSDWVLCVMIEGGFWEELEDVDEPSLPLSSFVLPDVEVEVQLAQYWAINLRYSLHPSAFDSFSPPLGGSGSCDNNKYMQGTNVLENLLYDFSLIYQTSINLRVPEDCHFEVLMVVATTADSNTGHTAHIALNNHSNFPMKLVK